MEGIGQCFIDAVAKLGFASGDAGDSTLTRCPVAGRHIEENDFNARSPCLAVKEFWRKLVGKQKLRCLVPGIRCGLEAVKKGHFVKHHGKICCKSWHITRSPSVQKEP